MPEDRFDTDRIARVLDALADQLAAAREALVEASAAVRASDGTRPTDASSPPPASPGASPRPPAEPALPSAPSARSRPAPPAGGAGPVPSPAPTDAAETRPSPAPDRSARVAIDPWTPDPAASWRPDPAGLAAGHEDGSAGPDDAPPVGAVVPRTQVASLRGVPLLSAGLVEALIGPIGDLEELDDIEARIARFPGVVAVSMHRLDGSDALMLIELDHPVPLADMLREDLGRPVASCRLAEGRIAVEIAPE